MKIVINNNQNKVKYAFNLYQLIAIYLIYIVSY